MAKRHPSPAKRKPWPSKDGGSQVSPYDRASSMLLALLITIGVVVVAAVHALAEQPDPRSAARRSGGDDRSLARTAKGAATAGRPAARSSTPPPTNPSSAHDKETTDVQQNLSVAGRGRGRQGGRVGRSRTGGSHPARQLRHRRRHLRRLRRRPRTRATGRASPAAPPLGGHVPEGNTLDLYARQLDFFGIELGVLMPDNKIIYAFNLRKPKPDTRKRSPTPPSTKSAITSPGGAATLQQADRGTAGPGGNRPRGAPDPEVPSAGDGSEVGHAGEELPRRRSPKDIKQDPLRRPDRRRRVRVLRDRADAQVITDWSRTQVMT